MWILKKKGKKYICELEGEELKKLREVLKEMGSEIKETEIEEDNNSREDDS